MTVRRKYESLAASVTAVVLATAAWAQTPAWNIMKPSTTGIPGEEMRLMAFDPQGNLWVGARWTFWGECGLAKLSADQLPYEPLPGGGFDTGAWRVWSSVHHPIPSVYLSDIEFGQDGVVWLASDGGLTRFDPNASTPAQMWQTYNAPNSPLIVNEVRSLDMDSEGNLWLTNVGVQSVNGALFKFSPATNQWTQFMVGQQLPWNPPWYNVNAVHVGLSGKVYVTHSTLAGFAEFNGTTWTLHSGGIVLGGILEDQQGNVWFTTAQNGLIKWDGTSFQSFNLGSQGTVTALGMDPAGLVYAGSWYGDIFKLVNGTTPQFLFNADNIPGSIHVRSNGEIWINNYGGNGTLGTVRHYDANGVLLERFNTYNSGLPDYFIDNNIQTDSAGNMWFACGEGGLSRMAGSNGAPDAPTHWRNWGNHNDFSEPYPFAGNEPMYAMFEDAQGNIWMGGNGVARWDPTTGDFTGFWNWTNSSFGVDDMHCFAQQPDGTIWVGVGYAGAYHYDPQTNNWVQHTWAPPGWTANEVIDMTTDSDGNLWILTFVQLHRLTPQGAWATWDSTNSPMTLGSLFDLEPGRSADGGGVWIGMQGKMLHFDGLTWTTITQAQAGWPGNNVTGIAIRASDGCMAVTTQQPSTWPYTGGVSVREENGSWTHWTTANSPLTHWQVSAPRFDAQGDLWASAMSEGVVEILLGSVETSVTIVAANPPIESPYVTGQPFRDVLQTGNGLALTQGIGADGTPAEGAYTYAQISITFSGAPAPPPTAGNVAVSCTDLTGNGQSDCPTVTGVTGASAGPYTLTLGSAIPPRECTTFTFAGTNPGQKLQYQSLPGDVNLDGASNTQDLLFLVQRLNDGSANIASNWARYNVDRSTQALDRVNTQDLLREVQSLNGINTTQVFAGASVAACP